MNSFSFAKNDTQLSCYFRYKRLLAVHRVTLLIVRLYFAKK